MRSILIQGPGKVELIEHAEPIMNADEVLLKIQYIGLCGSDLNSYRGLSPMVTYPVVPGHEVSGIIAAKGNNVPDHIKVGDHVTVNPYSFCGQCPACRKGRTNTCEFNQTLGVQRNGALSEYFNIDYKKILTSKLLNDQEFALVEPLSVGYHAANRGKVAETDLVLVIGCGMIGIGAVLACLKKGAKVIVADLDDAKLQLVKSFGVKHVINVQKQDLLSEIKEITNGRGVNVCIEAVGSPATYTAAVEAAAFAGRIVYVGYAKNEVSFNTSLFVKKELDILGSRNVLFEFEAVIQLLEEKMIPTEKLISKIYPMEEAAAAFKDWSDNPSAFVKILIAVNGDAK